MEDLYYTGSGIALILGIFKLSVATSVMFSQRARNMARVGLYFQPSTGGFVKKKQARGLWPFALSVLLIDPLLSWISVGYTLWSYFSAWVNKTPTPDKVKELQYKIAHVDLSKEKMVEALTELSKVLDLPLSLDTLDPTHDDDHNPNYCVLETGDWHRDITVFPQQKKYVMDSHPNDYSGIYDSTYEYKIQDNQVWQRLLEDSANHYGEIENNIKDNVVLESEIKKRHDKESLHLYSLEETLERYRSDTQWHEITFYKIKYFILSRHPEIVSTNELKKLIRYDLENFRRGLAQLSELVKRHGGKVLESHKKGIEFRYGENQSEDEVKAIRKLFEPESLKTLGLSTIALDDPKRYESELKTLLGEKSDSNSQQVA